MRAALRAPPRRRHGSGPAGPASAAAAAAATAARLAPVSCSAPVRACPRLGLSPAPGGLAGLRAGRGVKVHTLYVQLVVEGAAGAADGAAPRVMLGCFEDAQLP